MASIRQIEANRRNCRSSTGPTSDVGKLITRRAALKHGLAGAGVVLPEEEAKIVADRMVNWRSNYQPATPREEWLFSEIVVNSVRVERCRAHESGERSDLVRRAEVWWESDRRLAVERVAARLSSKPVLVAAELRSSRYGCLWLIERWEKLAEIGAAGGAWNEAQTRLAYDMLGTPEELRNRPPWHAPGTLDGFARCEISMLRVRLDVYLDEADDRDQAKSEMGIESEPSRPVSLLRRYENACWRKLVWAENRLVAERNGREKPTVVTPAAAPIVDNSPYVSPGRFFGDDAPVVTVAPVAMPVGATVPVPVAAAVPAAAAEAPMPPQSQPRRPASSGPSEEVLARARASLSRLPARYQSDDDLELPGVKAYSAAAAEASSLAQCSPAIRLIDALASSPRAPNRRMRRAAKRESARVG